MHWDAHSTAPRPYTAPPRIASPPSKNKPLPAARSPTACRDAMKAREWKLFGVRTGGPQLRAEVDGPLAEQFGGSLELVEESGAQGAVFALCIPVVREDSADGTTRAARRRPSDRRTVGS